MTEVIAPGDTPGAVGTLSVSNITVAAGVLYEADYGGAASDTVTASGNLTLQGGGTVNLNLHGLLPPLNDITLFSFSSITDATNLSQWVITGDKPETYYLTLKRVNNTLQLVFLPQGTLIRIL